MSVFLPRTDRHDKGLNQMTMGVDEQAEQGGVASLFLLHPVLFGAPALDNKGIASFSPMWMSASGDALNAGLTDPSPLHPSPDPLGLARVGQGHRPRAAGLQGSWP